MLSLKNNQELYEYYSLRAPEYEEIYDREERREELKALADDLKKECRGLNVLELACGTGYWSMFIASTAKTLRGVDFSEKSNVIAQSKLERARQSTAENCKGFLVSQMPERICPIEFNVGNVFELREIDSDYQLGFSGFFWSHVPIGKLPTLLNLFHSKLAFGSKVVWIDNNYVEGVSTRIYSLPSCRDTFQKRSLRTGRTFEVLKNFPKDPELESLIAPYSSEIEIQRTLHFCRLSYTLNRIDF